LPLPQHTGAGLRGQPAGNQVVAGVALGLVDHIIFLAQVLDVFSKETFTRPRPLHAPPGRPGFIPAAGSSPTAGGGSRRKLNHVSSTPVHAATAGTTITTSPKSSTRNAGGTRRASQYHPTARPCTVKSR